LAGDANLEFVAMPALEPPEFQMAPELMEKYEAEIEAAKNAPLPEEDEDL
jgi:GTP-binding nuclear protein Ran